MKKRGPYIAREFSIDRDNLYLSKIKIKIKIKIKLNSIQMAAHMTPTDLITPGGTRDKHRLNGGTRLRSLA